MWLPSPLYLLLAPLSLTLAATAPLQNFVNTAIARTIELGGATTSTTTQYNVKAKDDAPGLYHLALANVGEVVPAWWEVQVGGKVIEGLIPLLVSGAPTVVVPLGDLKKGGATTISVNSLSAHASEALPKEIAQTDAQYLLWQSESTYVASFYQTDVERIKIRSPTPNILSAGTVPRTYVRESDVTKVSSTLTLGPFHSLPPTIASEVTNTPFFVHFESKDPVVGLRSLKRSAEVSHWGGNLNIQDEMDLRNMGPKLKGHFSRLAHQQSKFHASTPAQILSDLTLRLPPTAHSPYYYDTIGNVSTSHFRQGSTPASLQRSTKVRTSPRLVDGVLELKPRYPLLGGWNYSFVVGWDMPLGDIAKVEKDGKVVLGVPFLTGWRDLLVDDAELKVILPEGAKDVEVHAPFPVDNITHSITKTYLDSTGRHTITLKKSLVTENHAQNIYITYHYPFSASLQKPLTVASVVGGLFVVYMGLRRVNYGFEKKI